MKMRLSIARPGIYVPRDAEVEAERNDDGLTYRVTYESPYGLAVVPVVTQDYLLEIEA